MENVQQKVMEVVGTENKEMTCTGIMNNSLPVALTGTKVAQAREFMSEIFGSVRTVTVNGKVWFVGKDVAECLGYAKPNNAINAHCKSTLKQNIPHPQSLDKVIEVSTIDEYDVIRLVEKCRTLTEEQKKLFLTEIGIDRDNVIVVSSRKEIEFINQLEETLKPFGYVGEKQYNVNGYRIDYYIPNMNVAIEYDENDHKGYSYEAQELRQQEIEEQLGCRFIRVSDKQSHGYNVGVVIKELLCA